MKLVLHRHWLVWAAVTACLAAGLASAEDAKKREGPPDIVMITVDTTRADHLGPYGYEKANTPAIDLMARIGVVFTDAISPFPRTTPALASLMTGLWPQHHGSREVGRPFENGKTLAEVLVENDYAAFGVSANWMAGRKHNLQKGFSVFVSMKSRKTDDRAVFVTQRLLTLVNKARPEKPIFVWAHYMDPHFPYNPPKDFKGTPPSERCKKMMQAISKKKLRLAAVQGNRRKLGERTLEDCIARYDAEITYMDRQIGMLMKGLEKAGRLENVIIVFTGDHGEALGDGGLYYEHGTTLHDSVVRVPLIIAGPGVKPGTDEKVIRLEDLMPTILGLAEIPRDSVPETDGVDQSWRLTGGRRWPWQKREDVIALAEGGSAMLIGAYVAQFEGHLDKKNCVHGPRYSLCTLPKRGTGLYDRQEDPLLKTDVSEAHPEDVKILTAARERWTPGEARQRMARSERFKLVETPRLEGGFSKALYDLDADPSETQDVSAKYPGTVKELSEALNDWSKSLPTEAPPEPSEEDLEALRALGYVD